MKIELDFHPAKEHPADNCACIVFIEGLFHHISFTRSPIEALYIKGLDGEGKWFTFEISDGNGDDMTEITDLVIAWAEMPELPAGWRHD